MSDPLLLTPPGGVEHIRITHRSLGTPTIDLNIAPLLAQHPEPRLSQILLYVQTTQPTLFLDASSPTSCHQLLTESDSVPHILLESPAIVDAIADAQARSMLKSDHIEILHDMEARMMARMARFEEGLKAQKIESDLEFAKMKEEMREKDSTIANISSNLAIVKGCLDRHKARKKSLLLLSLARWMVDEVYDRGHRSKERPETSARDHQAKYAFIDLFIQPNVRLQEAMRGGRGSQLLTKEHAEKLMQVVVVGDRNDESHPENSTTKLLADLMGLEDYKNEGGDLESTEEGLALGIMLLLLGEKGFAGHYREIRFNPSKYDPISPAQLKRVRLFQDK